MSIKWKDIKIAPLAISNKIVFGKVKTLKSGHEVWTDKSEDKTEEVKRAIAEYMLRNISDKNNGNCLVGAQDKFGFTLKDGLLAEITLTILEGVDKQ